jgi:hypothetical protein
MRIIDDSWKKFRVLLYIREAAAKKFGQEFSTAEEVEIRTPETIAFPWNWEWASAKLKKEADERASATERADLLAAGTDHREKDFCHATPRL